MPTFLRPPSSTSVHLPNSYALKQWRENGGLRFYLASSGAEQHPSLGHWQRSVPNFWSTNRSYIPPLKFSPNFPSSFIPVSFSWESYHSWVEGSFLLNKMKLPMRDPERNWQRAAMFSALMQLKTPSEKKIKGYPRQRRCISKLSIVGWSELPCTGIWGIPAVKIFDLLLDLLNKMESSVTT